MSAADSRCRQCGGPLPPKKATGRPRAYCSRGCRRQWHTAKEGLERMAEDREARIEEAYARELVWYGKRQADKERRRRRQELEADIAAWTEELWEPNS
jgi:hypothetical protein